MRIAFVAFNRNPALFRADPSFRYRCENLAGALKAAGHEVELLHVRSLALRSRFDLAVFHRPRWSLRLELMLKLLRRRGAVCIADVDDLIFEPEVAPVSPATLNGKLPLKKVRAIFRAHRRALACFDRITVSTAPLAEHVADAFPGVRAQVLPNAVYYRWRLPEICELPKPDLRALTYLPGTPSHDRDFALVAEAVAELLARHPELSLHVTGPLRFELPARPGQVVRHEKVLFEQYHERVRAGWVNLAPLEPTPFTRCKSALKVMEAGFWNTPTVCSPIPDTERFLDAGAIPAVSPEEWVAKVEALLDPETYRTATADLRRRVLSRADVHEQAKGLLSFAGLGEASEA